MKKVFWCWFFYFLFWLWLGFTKNNLLTVELSHWLIYSTFISAYWGKYPFNFKTGLVFLQVLIYRRCNVKTEWNWLEKKWMKVLYFCLAEEERTLATVREWYLNNKWLTQTLLVWLSVADCGHPRLGANVLPPSVSTFVLVQRATAGLQIWECEWGGLSDKNQSRMVHN